MDVACQLKTTRAGYLQYSISPDKLLKASISGTRV